MGRAVININLPFVMKKKANVWVSSCPALDVVSQGKSEVEAKKNLEEALKLFLEVCLERGTLEAVMKECGFSLITRKIRSKKASGDVISVPLPFDIKGNSPSQCHA